MRQGELSVSQYYNILARHWQQLNVFEGLQWDCPGDAVRYQKVVEKDRTFMFLPGPYKDLDEVRGRILGTKPLHSLREAFSEVRREKNRKRIMFRKVKTLMTSKSYALAAHGTSSQRNDKPSRKGRLWCDHCHRPGHMRESCWKIHGKPADWKPARSSSDQES